MFEALACGRRGRGGVSALGPGRREVGCIIIACGHGRTIPVRCWGAALCGTTRAHHAFSEEGSTAPSLQRGGPVRWRRPPISISIVCRRSSLEWRRCRRGSTWRAPTHRWPARPQATPSKGRVRVTVRLRWCRQRGGAGSVRAGVAAWPWVLALGGVPRGVLISSTSLHHTSAALFFALSLFYHYHVRCLHSFILANLSLTRLSKVSLCPLITAFS